MSEEPTENTPSAATDTADKTKKTKKEKPEPQGLWRGWIRPLLTVILVVTALRSTLVDWNDVPTGSMIPTVAVGDRIVVNKLSYGFNLPFNGPELAIPFVGKSIPWPLDFLPGFYYSAPERNDIVTFWKPGGFFEPAYDQYLALGASEEQAREAATTDDGGIRMVKRVVAIPGDEVQMIETVQKFDGREFKFSKLIINGEEATYSDKRGVQLTETIHGESRRIQYVRNTVVEDGQGRRGTLNLRPQSLNFGPYKLKDNQFLMIGDNRDNSQDGRFFGPVDLKQITGKAKFVAVSFTGSYTTPAWSRFFMGFDKGLQSDE